MEWIIRYVELNFDFISETLSESAQLSTTTSKPNTILHDVGIEFWRSVFKSAEDSSLDFAMVLSIQ